MMFTGDYFQQFFGVIMGTILEAGPIFEDPDPGPEKEIVRTRTLSGSFAASPHSATVRSQK